MVKRYIIIIMLIVVALGCIDPVKEDLYRELDTSTQLNLSSRRIKSEEEFKEGMSVINEIVYWASVYDVDTELALRIAHCESTSGLNLYNDISSAKGIFMFVDGTWANYCKGDVLNQTDNIKCFMELYPLYNNWWECK